MVGFQLLVIILAFSIGCDFCRAEEALESIDCPIPLILTVASDSSGFQFFLSNSGLVSIISLVKGKKAHERLWGPKWLEAGTQSVILPTNIVSGKTGTLECFTLNIEPSATIGRAGKGERQFIRPMGMGWDPTHKELYVCDTGNDRVVRLSADGRFISQYGGFGVAFGDSMEEREDSLNEPWDVAPGGFSNMYVADLNNNRICEFDAYKSFRGNLFPKKDDRQNRLDQPKGIVVDNENNVWAVDSRSDRVLKLSPSGVKLFELGGFGWSKWQFKDPSQVAVDPDGKIYVCDRGHRRIQVFDRFGSHLFEIKDNLNSPVGISVDPDGLIWVSDDRTNEVSIFTPDGKRLDFFPKASKGDRLRAPSDLVSLENFVFILDSGNHRIVVFKRSKKAFSSSWNARDVVLK
ncbi:NHL repeat-containing protein [bacterium]|nr:NHL repeat-containing protein [bacterium]